MRASASARYVVAVPIPPTGRKPRSSCAITVTLVDIGGSVTSSSCMAAAGIEATSRRIVFVADELLGYAGNGIGTTTTFVSVALARLGYHVEVLFAGPPRDGPVEPEWQRLYDDAGVRVREVPVSTQRVEP